MPPHPHSDLLATAPMAATENSQTWRVKEITEFIHSRNLSMNEFLIAFYSSEDPSISGHQGRCLAKRDGPHFAPEVLMDLWCQYCPPNSRSYLETAIVNHASKIIIKETNKACKLDSLCIPTTKLGANDLDQQFLLSQLEGIYVETLPHLWCLLTSVIISWNPSEKRKNEQSSHKQSRAVFVEFSLVSLRSSG